ncbi:MAG: hypothetical protein IKG14_01730 [Clostridia bacterium]|nr:hypothetical protein [Clostridia bacterium]
MLNNTIKKIKINKIIFIIICVITILLSSNTISQSASGAELKSINDIGEDGYIDFSNQQGMTLYLKSSSGVLVSSSAGTVHDYDKRR